jgi:uncharacterized phiE125 gp8 family phage protein
MADPVTVAEARIHLRLPSNITTDEQDEIGRLISAATEYAENFTNRKWTTGSRVQYFDNFPTQFNARGKALNLPGGNIEAVTSVTYYDSEYVQQTLATEKYRLIGAPQRAAVVPNFGEQWPTDVAYNEPDHIAVTYTLDGSVDVPSSVKQAILLTVGALYEYREDGVIDNAGLALVKAPKAAEDLLSFYRIRIS